MAGLGRRIRDRREEMGLTQARLAKLSATSQQHVSLIEKGLLEPTLATLRRILAALELRISLEPQNLAAETKCRLEGFRRFNSWEESRPSSGRQEAFRKAGEWALFLRPPQDLREKAREWKKWRQTLPR